MPPQAPKHVTDNQAPMLRHLAIVQEEEEEEEEAGYTSYTASQVKAHIKRLVTKPSLFAHDIGNGELILLPCPILGSMIV
jgi:hypothetical protein